MTVLFSNSLLISRFKANRLVFLASSQIEDVLIMKCEVDALRHEITLYPLGCAFLKAASTHSPNLLRSQYSRGAPAVISREGAGPWVSVLPF